MRAWLATDVSNASGTSSAPAWPTFRSRVTAPFLAQGPQETSRRPAERAHSVDTNRCGCKAHNISIPDYRGTRLYRGRSERHNRQRGSAACRRAHGDCYDPSAERLDVPALERSHQPIECA